MVLVACPILGTNELLFAFLFVNNLYFKKKLDNILYEHLHKPYINTLHLKWQNMEKVRFVSLTQQSNGLLLQTSTN